VQYVLAGSTATLSNQVIRVLDLSQPSLPVVASYFFSATTFANAALFFQLPRKCSHDDNYYIALQISNATIIPDPENPTIFLSSTGCPNALQVLQFLPRKAAIILVAQANLPAAPNSVGAWPRNVLEAKQARQDSSEDIEPKVKTHKSKIEQASEFALIASNTVVTTGTLEVSPFQNLPDGTSTTVGCLGKQSCICKVVAEKEVAGNDW